jgi:hypothetical protein
MKRRITAAQRRALLWLAQHDGDQSMMRLMGDGHVAVQTVHNLIHDKLVHARYARVWASGARPIESVGLTAVGRAMVSAECPHDWRQVELDMQQCERCNATRVVAGIAGR